MAYVLVTGAARGIGLALVQAHVARGDAVLATCRAPSPELAASGAEVLDGIELTEPAGVARIVAALGARRLDRAILNAGVLRVESLDELVHDGGADAVLEQFEVNALAPLRLAAALRGHLAPGARIGLVTSRMGSITDNGSGGYYGYRMSKAALNAGARSLAIDLAGQQALVFILHPGFVRTAMTGGRGDVTPAQSAAGLIERMDTLGAEHSGSFWHANGTPLPW
ncbi:MAG: SDR family oxidoreductase [Xanthomonadaceae bacterium]|jgi:NAD(P)-dependent dehydrogenase (short-subunit alcohol dehydrogenase family)|nr:SDR family oxidoreductase [Xanthomonadaceae bacterium]